MTATTPVPFATTIWVSLDGDDAAPGTRYAPLRTIAAAHAAIVRFAEEAPPKSRITIVLMDGTHPIDAPLVFGPELFGPDGPTVRFVAEGDAAPVISGGRRIEGWTVHDAERNIYAANAQGLHSRQFYVDGRRAVRARTTMADGGIPAGFRPSPILPSPAPSAGAPYVIGGGIDFLPTDLNPAGWRDPAQWRKLDQIEAVIDTQWKTMRLPLRSRTLPDGATPGTLYLAQPGWTNANLFFTPTKTDPIGVPGIWSFWQVTRFENGYEFLDEPGEWVLDTSEDRIFYIPRPGEDLATAEAILPALEILVEARGTPERPVTGLSFEGIGFRYATWLEPSGDDGYVADQSGFHLRGDQHQPNLTGHDPHVVRTPGNLRFAHAHGIRFDRCSLAHLGAVAIDFDTGSQRNSVTRCTFDDIASAAIQIGGIDRRDFEPSPADHTRDHVITDNHIRRTGRDYADSAAIYLGFTTNSLVAHNSISETPWAGIALGWGWGLLDPGSFPGISNATSGMWGLPAPRTVNCGNIVANNHISHFLETLWDGGAIYCCGWQGNGFDDALRIENNVACDKRPKGGGNILYTDGGSRFVKVTGNALFDNAIGAVDLGPPPRPGDPLPYIAGPSKLNGIPYGGDIGGCRTYGDIHYSGNYWAAGLIPIEEGLIDLAELAISKIFTGEAVDTYSPQGFFDVCPYSQGGISYPTGLVFEDNHKLPFGRASVPAAILAAAGVRGGGGAYVATGRAPHGGGAAFPPLNPGPSWNVPRVSLPGLFGMQKQFAQEWWYYVGIAEDDAGQRFGLQLEIGRFAVGSIQLCLGLTGIGWRDGAGGDQYLSGEGIGFGAARGRPTLASAVIPPVGDHAYSAHFRPLIEVVGRSDDLSRDVRWNLPLFGTSKGWKFDYLQGASNAAPIGTPGSRYALAVQGRGCVTGADSAVTRPARYSVDLALTDRRGTVMEGLSGYVGPAMFENDDIGLSSYECAQPVLRIERGGITLDDRVHAITGGTLWLDRQMIAKAAGDGAPTASVSAALRGQTPSPRELYLGDWIAVTLDDGLSLALALFWQPSNPQWITGTAVGRPPKQGFGNLYLPVRGTTPQGNGGLALTPRTATSGDDWDFDLNILDPDAPTQSPHWKSPASGKTYATAWRIDFAPRAQHQGLPPVLYLHTVSDNCEIIPATPSGAFFEGAALVYADRERQRRIGQAFVEQMGFN
ncbi:hypothetical protein U1769_09695 [Sphingomonas sp. ZT3P38]|uniref:hypothetical protein n=1 Tax=Parasphingomonas zepuensis TaxID=3096161 RepID=UPI002FCB92A2